MNMNFVTWASKGCQRSDRPTIGCEVIRYRVIGDLRGLKFSEAQHPTGW
jgi:hypothetical protein